VSASWFFLGVLCVLGGERFKRSQRFGQAANQEHSRVPGSGLGLSICRALASRLGGDIGYRTELGKGSVFWVDMPRAKSQAAGMSAA